MRVTAYPGAGEFLAATRAALEENEAANNLMLGVCLRLRQHPERIKQPPFPATVDDERNPISNHIYQSIGYRPVCDIHEILFSATQ